ncbi:MAG: hypothetical protein G01um10148_254 [Parcubacteria group bacterium Gr01-1014_8]|nr:MAG: hypothetical protein G01um10148_254 [Parcubacteria group bacterium Gr01-1014_8]
MGLDDLARGIRRTLGAVGIVGGSRWVGGRAGEKDAPETPRAEELIEKPSV